MPPATLRRYRLRVRPLTITGITPNGSGGWIIKGTTSQDMTVELRQGTDVALPVNDVNWPVKQSMAVTAAGGEFTFPAVLGVGDKSFFILKKGL